MMVVGGAIVPEVQGFLADRFGYQHSFIAVLLCYAYVIYFAFSGYKLRQPHFATLPELAATPARNHLTYRFTGIAAQIAGSSSPSTQEQTPCSPACFAISYRSI